MPVASCHTFEWHGTSDQLKGQHLQWLSFNPHLGQQQVSAATSPPPWRGWTAVLYEEPQTVSSITVYKTCSLFSQKSSKALCLAQKQTKNSQPNLKCSMPTCQLGLSTLHLAGQEESDCGKCRAFSSLLQNLSRQSSTQGRQGRTLFLPRTLLRRMTFGFSEAAVLFLQESGAGSVTVKAVSHGHRPLMCDMVRQRDGRQKHPSSCHGKGKPGRHFLLVWWQREQMRSSLTQVLVP